MHLTDLPGPPSRSVRRSCLVSLQPLSYILEGVALLSSLQPLSEVQEGVPPFSGFESQRLIPDISHRHFFVKPIAGLSSLALRGGICQVWGRG